jgi:succinate-semialdehyde dehydrogenase/glutarate-semialdehyde dehydrogenase
MVSPSSDKSRQQKDIPTDAPMLDVFDPVTGDTIGKIPITSAQSVADAVERARFAQKTWGALSVTERTQYIRRWVDLVWENQAEGIRILRRENGKPDSGAFLEIMSIDGIAQYYIHQAPQLLKPKRRRSLFPGVQWAKVFYKPHGVVGVISPWNYPFTLAFMDMIPALIAGNTVVMKPSEVTPFVAEWGVELMYRAGIPRDVVQIVHGDGRTGAALVEEVDYLQFTGSTAVGRKVGMRCAERLIPYSLELGGKDPSIVLNDADIDMTATGLIKGAFENAGQMCISIERVYVEDAIHDRLVERIADFMQDMNVSAGDGMNVHMGSLTNKTELERTQAHIEDAVAKGAKVIYGGKARPDLGPLFFEPTVLVDVDHSMDIMREETFGPVLPIMRVMNDDEAVRLANDTDYGLSASVFSSNLKRAQEIAQRIDSGDVSVNRAQFVIATPDLPSGGQRQSGSGRRNGPEGLLKFTATQSILLDNLLGQKPDLLIADPITLQLVKALRVIKRYVPFL